MLCRSVLIIFVFSRVNFTVGLIDGGCKIGLISGETNYTNEDFPSLAKIVTVSDRKFVCRATIISKNQLLTDPNCFTDSYNERKKAQDFLVVLKEINQNETAELNIAEFYFSHKEPHNDRELRSLIVITKQKIPFNFFIYSTCFREYLKSRETITEILGSNPCEKIASKKTNDKFAEIFFEASKSGALYAVKNMEWQFFGVFSNHIIDSGVCKNKNFSSFGDLNRYFKCDANNIRSPTVAIGPKFAESLCSDDVIFDEEFETLNSSFWRHENTLRGGGNWEFQWYSPDPENSFTQDGILHIRPTLTSDKFSERFLKSGTAKIPLNQCTDSKDYGCKREGKYNLINPIRSASISSVNSFSFKFGTIEIRAKAAVGDWLTSTISLLPKKTVYGEWPKSGQIDLLEIRGNRNLTLDDESIGVDQVSCTLHFGGRFEDTNQKKSITNDFHVYKMKWTENSLTFSIDGEEIQKIEVQKNLWKDFNNHGDSPWPDDSKIAPFDKEFYIIISLKVGGTALYPEDAENGGYKKPWDNDSEHASEEFWHQKEEWLETWREDKDFLIDYVRVTAL